MKKIIHIIGVSCIALFGFISIAYAGNLIKTPTNLKAGDQTVLHQYMGAADTTIYLEPVTKYINGVKTKECLKTGSGFAVIQDTSRTEWVSFGSNSCNSTTNITTLGFVVRGLNPDNPTFTSGTGLAWDAGASFKVIDWPLLYNNSLYKDINNSLSGSIICNSTSQPCFIGNGVTTTQRNNFLFGTAAGYYPDIFNTTLGVKQYWNGTSWVNYGSGSTVNATETVRGAVQLGTVNDQNRGTTTGTSGASTVVQTQYLTQTGSVHTNDNSSQKGKIPILNSTGALAASLGGLGIVNATSGSLIVGQGSGKVKLIAPGSSNNFLISRGGSWVSGATTQPPTTIYSFYGSKNYFYPGSGGGTGTLLTTTMTGNTISVGTSYEIVATGTGSNGGTSKSMKLVVVVGSSSYDLVTSAATSYSNAPWRIRCHITFYKSGASGVYDPWCESVGLSSATLVQFANASPGSLDTTSNQTLAIKVAVPVGASNGMGATLYQAIIQKYN